MPWYNQSMQFLSTLFQRTFGWLFSGPTEEVTKESVAQVRIDEIIEQEVDNRFDDSNDPSDSSDSSD
jgi:hypothetical protein